MSKYFSVDSQESNSYIQIKNYIYEASKDILNSTREIIILCIGTDRCTGDSLGPFVGDKLKKILPRGSNIYIYGTIENPVHSLNLESVINKIYSNFKDPYTIDASLGNINDIGKVIIKPEKLTPGSALNKNLPSIGDLSIKGIVNMAGNFEFLVLQSTRLYVVLTLADSIYRGLYHFILKIQKDKESLYNFSNK